MARVLNSDPMFYVFTQAQATDSVIFDLPINNLVIFVNIVGGSVSLFEYGVCEVYAAVTGGDFVSMYTALGAFEGSDASPTVLLTSFGSEV